MLTAAEIQACQTGGELKDLRLTLSLPEKVQLCRDLNLGDFEPKRQTLSLCYSAMLDCVEAVFKYWRENRPQEQGPKECP